MVDHVERGEGGRRQQRNREDVASKQGEVTSETGC